MNACYGSSRLRDNRTREHMSNMLPSQKLSPLANFDGRRAIHTRRLCKTNSTLP